MTAAGYNSQVLGSFLGKINCERAAEALETTDNEIAELGAEV
jgi:hypothetical protein